MAHGSGFPLHEPNDGVQQESRPTSMRSNSAARNLVPRPSRAFAPWNIFSALLLEPEQSGDVVKRILQGYGIALHLAASVPEADRIIRSTRLDLAICDFELPQADQLACLQSSGAWHGVTIGLVPRAGMHHFRSKRVQLRMSKPVSADMLVRCLKASYSNMARQRIATYRHTVPARLISGTLNHRGWQRTLHQVNVLNLSQTGLCLSAAEPLPHGASLTMSLALPERSLSVHTSGNIVWSHSSGRTGVAFERAACPEMRKLQELLNASLPRDLGMVAGQV